MKRAKMPEQLVPKPNETWTLLKLKGWKAATENVNVGKSGNGFSVNFTDSKSFGCVSFDTKMRESFVLYRLFVELEWVSKNEGPQSQPSVSVSYDIGGLRSATGHCLFASPECVGWNFEFNFREAGDMSCMNLMDAKLTLEFAHVNENDSFEIKNVWSVHKFKLPTKFVRLAEPRVVDEHCKIIGSTIDDFVICQRNGDQSLIKTDEYLVRIEERQDFIIPETRHLCDRLTKNLALLLANHYIRGQSTWELLVHIAACTRANERVPLFIVGGAIRDLCTGKSPENVNDIDCAVACSYDELVRSIKVFFSNRQIDLGSALHCDGKFKQNGMIKIDHGEGDSDSLDIGIFKIGRASGYPSAATLEAQRGSCCENNWVYGYSMVDDAKTRDFTMNAIYVDPLMWKVFDPLDRIGQTFCDNNTARAIFCNEKDLLSADGDLGGRFRFWKLLLQPERFFVARNYIESVDKRMIEDIERLERNGAADKGWTRKWVGKFTQKLGKGNALELLSMRLRSYNVTFFYRLKFFTGKVWKNHLIFKELQESVAGEKAIKDLFARISKLP